MTKQKLIYGTVKEFYFFYLSQHQNRTCRRLHFFGTTALFVLLPFIFAFKAWPMFFILPLIAYGSAWTGHFFFEKNRPATFQYPLYSLLCDFIMYKDILTGKIPF